MSSSVQRPAWIGMIWIGTILAVGAAALAAQQNARKFDPAREPMRRIAIQNGFGQLLPHRVPVPDDQGLPTPVVVDIRTQADLANVRPFNPILPSPSWPSAAVLPDATPGNHYLVARFDRQLDPDSVLDSLVSVPPDDQLLASVNVVALDPTTGEVVRVSGRAFIGGRTYGTVDPHNPNRRLFEQWVELDAQGRPRASVIGGKSPGLGFPGTQSGGSFP